MKYFFLFLGFYVFPMHSNSSFQDDIPNILTEVINSPHWEGFFCYDSLGRPLIDGILSHNQIPLYKGLNMQEKSIEMYIDVPTNKESRMIGIKKFKLKENRCRIKVLYDKRVKANFRLAKTESGDWKVYSSTFNQKRTCDSKNKNRFFRWQF